MFKAHNAYYSFLANSFAAIHSLAECCESDRTLVCAYRANTTIDLYLNYKSLDHLEWDIKLSAKVTK